MSFSLYRCGDDTYVAVPGGLSPPMEAIRLFGSPLLVRASPHNIPGSEAWAAVSLRIDQHLFAVIDTLAVDDLFLMA